MKLLVTGGAGFIGSNFIEYWLNTYPNDDIVNVDALTYAANPITVQRHQSAFPNRYHFEEGNISDKKLVHRLVEACDVIIHFAAESHVDRSVVQPSIFLETNILGTHTLLDAALTFGKKRFHHVSTDEVFGTLPLNSTEKFTEKSPYDPRSPYSASKAASDHLVRAYYETYGLPITITNCSNNYGPYHFPEKVIPLYILRMLRQLPYPIYAQGLAVRDYLYVEDHCRAIDMVLKKAKPGSTYCVGGDSERTTVQVADALTSLMGVSPDLRRFTADRPGHDPRYAIDHSTITNELGWKPTVSFEEGLEKTVEWYKKNSDWWSPLLHRAEEICERYLKSA